MDGTQFDGIADAYVHLFVDDTLEKSGYRKHIEAHTLLTLSEPLQGQSVLDIACGEGIFSRFLKRNGAASVIGVDLSAEMIRQAKVKEQQSKMGIEYHAGSVTALDQVLTPSKEFDLVFSTYVLNYASNKGELLQFCEVIFKFTKEGGRFVTCIDNPTSHSFPYNPSYGFKKEDRQPDCTDPEFHPVQLTIVTPDKDISFAYYDVSLQLIEDTLKQVGFKEIVWQEPLVDPSAKEELGENCYADLIGPPPLCSFFVARK